MDIIKSNGKAFSYLAMSLEEAQARYGEKPSKRKTKYVGHHENFIGPMWIDPKRHAQLKKKEKESANK